MHLSYFPRGPCVFYCCFPQQCGNVHTAMCFGTMLYPKGDKLTILSDERSVKTATKATAEEDGQPGMEEGQGIHFD